MQRPDRLHITAAASTGLLVGSVAVRAIDGDDPITAESVTSLLAMVCVVSVAATSLRRWLIQQEARNRSEWHDRSPQHRAQELTDLEEREARLRSREKLLERREYLNSIRVQGLAERLDEMTHQRAVDRAQHEETKANYQEVAAEFDALVRQTVRDGAERFTRPTTQATGLGALRAQAGPDEPARGITHLRIPAPTEAEPDFRPRAHHESV
ncbi:hypothetical protein [Streptomyces sp. NPDC047070]|uniref:hypothetical protein n=1 Tax=Streptomyces sp. NPDC047070 TaxID=3154923 RepID=UPI00345448A7